MKIEFESEKELEDIVVDYYEKNNVCMITDEENDYYLRQFNLGSYGVADIVTIDIEDDAVYCNVIELKKKDVCMKAMAQVSRYKTGLKEFLGRHYTRVHVCCYVVGTNIVKDDSVFLSNFMDIAYGVVKFDKDDGICCDLIGTGWHKSGEKFQKAARSLLDALESKKESEPLKLLEVSK